METSLVKLQEYQDSNVQKTLDADYRPLLLQQSVENEWKFLDALNWEGKVILDIGVGDGRHPEKYAPLCQKYIGVDIAEAMIFSTAKKMELKKITNVELFHTDAEFLEKYVAPQTAHIVLCLYFGAGNLRKNNFDVKNYLPEDITQNKKFIAIIRQMEKALKSGNSMYLTVYKDTKQTQDMQYEFYKGTGQHIISKRSDPFVATAEGFWSVRFTKELMLENLRHAGISEHQVIFHDNSEISWIVEIVKPSEV